MSKSIFLTLIFTHIINHVLWQQPYIPDSFWWMWWNFPIDRCDLNEILLASVFVAIFGWDLYSK